MQSVAANRYAWIDIAKGICIIAVVCYYANTHLGYVRDDTGWLAEWARFAQPFRMPDFFLLSGLFLSRVIDRPWRSYLDTKVVHYLYFLVLWTALYFSWRVATGDLHPDSWIGTLKHYLYFLVRPMAALWFIQTLAVFFVVTRLLHRVPTVWVIALAALGMVSRVHSGFEPLDNFLEYWVYFLVGARLAEPVFRWADAIGQHARAAWAGLLVWAALNAWLTGQGWTQLPGLDLIWSLVCILAVIAFSRLLGDAAGSGHGSDWLARPVAVLRHLGRTSIVVYLGFYLPLLGTLELLGPHAKTLPVHVLGVALVLVGVGGAMLLRWATRHALLEWLFERPAWARLSPAVRAMKAEVAKA